jgi:hypothetical protein
VLLVAVPTPPWWEQAPRPASAVVPSLQLTVAAAAATPPWCEQAPRPVWVAVVPSLQVTVAWAESCDGKARVVQSAAVAAKSVKRDMVTPQLARNPSSKPATYVEELLDWG